MRTPSTTRRTRAAAIVILATTIGGAPLAVAVTEPDPGWSVTDARGTAPRAAGPATSHATRPTPRPTRHRWLHRTTWRARRDCAAHSGSWHVRRGDTLSQISACTGVPVGRLAARNGISDPDRIRVGQELRIPAVAR